jgi:hypothetical protein
VGLFSRKAKTTSDESTDPASLDEITHDTSDDVTVDPASDGPAAQGAADADAATVQAAPQQLKVGPFDASDIGTVGPRVDLGSVRIPAFPGMQIRMEIDKKTSKITGVTVLLGESSLQIQAFAAPKTSGIWDDIRTEIASGITTSGGKVDDVPGQFGRELIAQLPQKAADGSTQVRPARFIGVDGPRWFLRGVITGKAATDTEAAKLLEAFFGQIVVVRDQSPRPPRDLLALNLPAQNGPAGQPGAVGAPDGAAPQAPDFNPLARGPEITEIR